MKPLSVDEALDLRLEPGYILIILTISKIGDAAYLYSVKEFDTETFQTLSTYIGEHLISKVLIRIHPGNDVMTYEYAYRNSMPGKSLRDFLRLSILLSSAKAHRDRNFESSNALVSIYVATMYKR
jgi:hypothetical protein